MAAKVAGNLVMIDATATYATDAGLSVTLATPNPVAAWSSLVSYVRADDYAGADGAAVTSVTPSAGTSDAFTGTCTLKTGSNGIGGRKVFRSNGTTNVMRTTTGGASLTGDFYVAALVQGDNVASNYTPAVAWGDSGSGQWRYLFLNSGGWQVVWYDGSSGYPAENCRLLSSTPYLVEAERSGGTLTVWINGRLQGSGTPAFTAYTSAVLRLFESTVGGNLAPMVLAEAVFVGRVLTAAERADYLNYIATYYSLGDPAAAFTSASALAGVQVYGLPDGRVSVGGTGNARYSTTLEVSAGDAHVSVWGTTVITGPAPHAIRSSTRYQNVVSIRNETQDGTGYSAVTFERHTGQEMAAVGFAPATLFPWGGPNGSTYLEASNFFDTTKPGDYRFVQTQPNLNSPKMRSRWRDDTRAHEEYDWTATEPSVSGPTAGLVSLRAKPVTAVANDGTLDTNITTGATQCGLVVVKDASSSRCAVYRLENTTLTAVSANAIFSTTSGNAGTVNVFNNSGQIRLENKTGGSLNLTAAFYGA